MARRPASAESRTSAFVFTTFAPVNFHEVTLLSLVVEDSVDVTEVLPYVTSMHPTMSLEGLSRMRWRPGRGKSGRLAAVVLVVGLCAPFLNASTAYADSFYPAGCDRYVRYSWADTCWLGHNYINYGVSVLGVQYILQYHGFMTRADCIFGSQTDSSVVAYQRAHGLTRDGIVGTQTWGSLQGQITFSGISDAYGNYFNNGSDGLRFYNNLAFGYWHVLDPYYPGGATYVAMSDADGIFCPPR
jgi:hypothetical protein